MTTPETILGMPPLERPTSSKEETPSEEASSEQERTAAATDVAEDARPSTEAEPAAPSTRSRTDVDRTIVEETIDVDDPREVQVVPNAQATVVLSSEIVQDVLSQAPPGAPDATTNRTVVLKNPLLPPRTPTSAPAPSFAAPTPGVQPSSVAPPRMPSSPAPSASRTPSRSSTKLWIGLGVGTFLVAALAGGTAMKAAASAEKHWVAPTVLASNDPRVMQVAATLQQETARHGELSLQRKDLEGRLDEAERSIALEEGFQASYLAALNADLQSERDELRRTAAQLAAEEAKAGTPGATPEKEAEYQAQLANVRRRINVLENARRSVAKRADLSRYDALALRREYNASLLAVSKGRELAAALRKSMAEIDALLKEKDELVASIRRSSYGAAIGGDVTIGFVPYENMNVVKTGDPLFACRLGFLFCTEVGTVGEPLPGEAKGMHPNGGRTLRGQMVRVQLRDPHAEERPILYAGEKPLF